MKNSMLKRRIARVAIPVCTAFLLGAGVTSCEDDLLTGQPSWLGESIYDELEQRGNFTQTLKLIQAQDEDYVTLLKKTGSKTLFVADDEAWQRFYQNNPWGVTSIDEMSEAQKKLLFKSNILTSAYLLELLGNIPGETPQEGACMRRSTELSGMDTVMYVPKSKYPVVNDVRRNTDTGEQIDYWSEVRDKDGIFMAPKWDATLNDFESPTMIHFMERFMKNNNIGDEDVKFLTNGEIQSNNGSFINGKVVCENLSPESDPKNIRRDITCQNGYIHQMEEVTMPLDNMANVIAGNPQFSIYNRLLDRFSIPYYDAEANREYHRIYGGSLEDSVYVRRYFNDHASWPLKATNKNVTVSTTLPYDPGWNRYRLNSTSDKITFNHDAAVMLVPTDDAMKKYLEEDGADLQARYGGAGTGETAWDNAPDAVVLPLLQNTMLTSLKAAVPSQFENINNTAGERMGVEVKDIDQVLWACNGVVYQTNKVYVAPEYVSVYYPCIIRADEDLRCVYATVEEDNKAPGGEGFRAYLTNMGSKYSFLIPTNNALQTYYDPVSYKRENARGVSTSVAYKFYVNDKSSLAAYPHLVDWTTLDDKGRGVVEETATATVSLSTGRSGDVFNHFKDIFNSSLCTSQIQWKPSEAYPQRFYLAKNGGPIVVDWDEATRKVRGVAGSFQYERGYYIPVVEEYDKSQEGNGVSLVLDQEPLMSTFMSPDSALHDVRYADQFGSFANFVGGELETRLEGSYSGHATMDYCLTNLNNYHYTIYVPTNASVDALVASHKLPTWDLVDDASKALVELKDMFDNPYVMADSIDAKTGKKVTYVVEDEDGNPIMKYTAEEMEQHTADSLYLEEQVTRMRNIITSFVNYHIQDNSVFIDGEEHMNDVFETACLDTLTNRFVKVYVNYTRGGDMVVTDNCGNQRTVSPTFNNVLTRQYYFDKSTIQQSTQFYSSAFAVIHQIDEPLVPMKNCYYDNESYDKVEELIARYPVGGGAPVHKFNMPKPIKRKRR